MGHWWGIRNKIKKLHWKLIKHAFHCLITKIHYNFITDWLIHANFIIIWLFFPHYWYPIYRISLQVISKICTIFASYCLNSQWFCRGSIKSKHTALFPKWVFYFFCDSSCKHMVISQHFVLQFCSFVPAQFKSIFFWEFKRESVDVLSGTENGKGASAWSLLIKKIIKRI